MEERSNNHPNRSTWRSILPVPTLDGIRESRIAAGYTQEQAARIAGLSGWRQWASWESGERRPQCQSWELWLLRVNQHPTHVLVPKTVRPT